MLIKCNPLGPRVLISTPDLLGSDVVFPVRFQLDGFVDSGLHGSRRSHTGINGGVSQLPVKGAAIVPIGSSRQCRKKTPRKRR
jgi:hypothetical protein